ncbi:MAG: hypothetical protein HBSAPP02_23270 [Phycisphaerae bacterium]|nr:MAG: hypothetical protein HBSAPP02_23270 [Phycisphaerae bacterium]
MASEFAVGRSWPSAHMLDDIAVGLAVDLNLNSPVRNAIMGAYVFAGTCIPVINIELLKM